MKTTPLAIERRERAARALSLRKAGATFEEIAQAVGYKNRSVAYKAVVRLLREMSFEDAQEYRRLELARIDSLSFPFYKLAVDRDAALTDRFQAFDRALAASRDRRRLLGIDAAAKVEVEASLLTPEERQAKLRTLFETVLVHQPALEADDEEVESD